MMAKKYLKQKKYCFLCFVCVIISKTGEKNMNRFMPIQNLKDFAVSEAYCSNILFCIGEFRFKV